MTLLGIKPATFWLLVQCLLELCHHIPIETIVLRRIFGHKKWDSTEGQRKSLY